MRWALHAIAFAVAGGLLPRPAAIRRSVVPRAKRTDDDVWLESAGVTSAAQRRKLLATGLGGAGLRAALQRIAAAVGGDEGTAARLVARAPLLLDYKVETLAAKMETLRQYLVGCDVDAMVRRQPMLLHRDMADSVASKLGLLSQMLPGANVAYMVERQPALLGADPETLVSNVALIRELFAGSTLGDGFFERAPCLLQYDARNLGCTLDKWRDLLPDADVAQILARAPTLLQLDVDANVGPKVRILGRAVKTDDLARLVRANPMLIAAALVRYLRLAFELEALASATAHLPDTAIHATLRHDKSPVSHWLARKNATNLSIHSQYRTFLTNRLSTVGRRPSISTDIETLEKLHAAKFADVELALLRTSLSEDSCDPGAACFNLPDEEDALAS